MAKPGEKDHDVTFIFSSKQSGSDRKEMKKLIWKIDNAEAGSRFLTLTQTNQMETRVELPPEELKARPDSHESVQVDESHEPQMAAPPAAPAAAPPPEAQPDGPPEAPLPEAQPAAATAPPPEALPKQESDTPGPALLKEEDKTEPPPPPPTPEPKSKKPISRPNLRGVFIIGGIVLAAAAAVAASSSPLPGQKRHVFKYRDRYV